MVTCGRLPITIQRDSSRLLVREAVSSYPLTDIAMVSHLSWGSSANLICILCVEMFHTMKTIAIQWTASCYRCCMDHGHSAFRYISIFAPYTSSASTNFIDISCVEMVMYPWLPVAIEPNKTYIQKNSKK